MRLLQSALSCTVNIDVGMAHPQLGMPSHGETEDQDDTGHRWSAISRFWSARIHVSLGFPLVGAPSAPMGITMWLARLGSGGPSTLALLRLSPCVACVRLRLATHHCTDCLTTTSPRIRSQPEDERACPGGADLLYQPNVSAAYLTFIT